jgi:hypothetical protein
MGSLLPDFPLGWYYQSCSFGCFRGTLVYVPAGNNRCKSPELQILEKPNRLRRGKTISLCTLPLARNKPYDKPFFFAAHF